MLESALTPYGTEFARRRSLDPMLEVSLPTETPRGRRVRCVDMVAWSASRVIAVEFKTTLNAGVVDQAASCRGYADECWALVYRATPQGMERAQAAGIGVLVPSESGSVEIALETTVNAVSRAKAHEWRDLLGRALARSVAGTPLVRGSGSRQQELGSLVDWFRANPKGSWRLAYRQTPNTADGFVALRTRHYRDVCAALGVERIG